MLSFHDWLMASESSPESRALNAPWAYPAQYVGGNPNSERTASPRQLKNWKKMVHRDTKKKHKKKLDEAVKKTRADHSFDSTVKEIELLKADLLKLSDKKSKQAKLPDANNPPMKRSPGTEDLLNLAKMALSNLKSAPDYYNTRKQDRTVNGTPSPQSTGKVSRSDAERAARELGVNFRDSKFNQEAFRKAIEFEFNRNTAFDRERRAEGDLA
jgi:hypothetical protein